MTYAVVAAVAGLVLAWIAGLTARRGSWGVAAGLALLGIVLLGGGALVIVLKLAVGFFFAGVVALVAAVVGILVFVAIRRL
ncbi:MAG: hypothetical protein KBD01_04890 [Acidobacteria bacterium]|nr:hypothetical protein [Acidobacteriota bacterium]